MLNQMSGRWLKHSALVLLALSLGAAFFISEASLLLLSRLKAGRLDSRHYLEQFKQLYMVSPNTEASYEHRPHADILFESIKGDDYTMRVTINSQGFREDKDIPFQKQERTKRIIGLGDSVMFGVSVEQDRTFLKELERRLSNDQVRVETINFGLGFSNPRLEFHTLSYKQADQYQPDLILFGFCLNDFDTRHAVFNPEKGFWEYPNAPRGEHEAWIARLKQFLLASRVVCLLNDARHQFTKPNTRPTQFEKNQVIYWLGRIKSYSDSMSARLVVIFFPYKEQLAYSLKTGDMTYELQKTVKEITRELNIPSYDLTPDLVEYMKTHKVSLDHFYWDSAHPWNEGHAAIGELVANWIKANQWL